jgi:hypothetical protein
MAGAQILRHREGLRPDFRGFPRHRWPARITRVSAGVGRPSTTYEARRAADSVVYQVVRDHYESFVAQTASFRDSEGLPKFIDEEFRGFLRCGWLAGGFARFRCEGCRLDRLVPFSCKGRAVCPSCGGRRMAERATHLVDHVFPAVPVRHWVLTVPPRLRYMVAWDHAVCRAVVGVFMRAVLGWLRRRAQVEQGIAGGRSGAVAMIQRFGAALNVNVHTHALVLDGVFAEDASGTLVFHPAPPPEGEALDALLATMARRIERLLRRRDVWTDHAEPGTGDPWTEEAPVLAGLAAASVQGRLALGTRAGGEVRRCGNLPDEPPLPMVRGPCHAARGGFDLDAGVVVPAGEVAHLERVCRYALRPPIAHDRIRLTSEGDVLLELRHRWRDGTTHLRFHPVELLERLASLTPRPRINLVLYYGVLAAHAAWRSRLPRPGQLAGNARSSPPTSVRETPADAASGTAPATSPPDDAAERSGANRLWARLMQRTFGFDVLQCPRCGGRLRLIAVIDEGAIARRILAHLGVPAKVPPARPPRPPPMARPMARQRVQHTRSDDRSWPE